MYLGVDLQHNLSWNQHVSRVTKRQTACSDSYSTKGQRRIQVSSLHVLCQIKYRLLLHRLESSPKRPELPIIVSEYDQEIPQSRTADYPVARRGRAAQPSRGTRKTNKAKQSALSSPSR